MPEEHRETADLEELIQTPQFRSQLERFSEALQTGQMDLGPVWIESGDKLADCRLAHVLKGYSRASEKKESEGKSAALMRWSKKRTKEKEARRYKAIINNLE